MKLTTRQKNLLDKHSEHHSAKHMEFMKRRSRAKYNRATGSNLQAPVTEKNPTGKRAARRKSFCARMKGMPGPLKDKKGRPTRKALALKRWRC